VREAAREEERERERRSILKRRGKFEGSNTTQHLDVTATQPRACEEGT
jgi:hypothetical protein